MWMPAKWHLVGMYPSRRAIANPFIGAMHIELTDEETAALTQELHDLVEGDKYLFSPHIRTLRVILVYARAASVLVRRRLQVKSAPGAPLGRDWTQA